MSLTRKNYSLCNFFILLILFIEWGLGTSSNINDVVIVTYIFYALIILKFNTDIFVRFSWLLIMASLNILGVYACENSKLYLIELDRYSYYCCALTPLVICYVLCFYHIGMTQYNVQYQVNLNRTVKKHKANIKIIRVINIIGIIVALFGLLKIIGKPYFIMGVTRTTYYKLYMTSFDTAIQSHLFLLIPFYYIYKKLTNDKKYQIIFFTLLILYYFWVGDKFGTYFFAGFIFILCGLTNLNHKKMKKVIYTIFIGFGLLLVLVYIQRILLYGSTFSSFLLYISERLAQQGQVWWAVYNDLKEGTFHITECIEELSVILPISVKGEIGQWKMMLIASPTSSMEYRVSIKLALSATTTASVFYYFRYIGLFVFYPLIGVIYSKIIKSFLEASIRMRVVEMFVWTKIVSGIHNVIFASDLSMFNVNLLFYLLLLWVSRYLEKNNYRLRI